MCRRVGILPSSINKTSQNVRKYLQDYTVSHPSRHRENFKSIKLTLDICSHNCSLLKVYKSCKAISVSAVTVQLNFFSMALRAQSGPTPLIQLCNHFSLSVGLLGQVIGPSQGRYLNTVQHKHRINAYTHNKHPCHEWDWNPRSRLPSERRQFRP
jgi:hypothetical protein